MQILGGKSRRMSFYHNCVLGCSFFCVSQLIDQQILIVDSTETLMLLMKAENYLLLTSLYATRGVLHCFSKN